MEYWTWGFSSLVPVLNGVATTVVGHTKLQKAWV